MFGQIEGKFRESGTLADEERIGKFSDIEEEKNKGQEEGCPLNFAM